MPMPTDMPQEIIDVNTAFMTIGWLMPLIAIAEIIGGILIIPAKTRALGAIIVFPVMIGIVLMHIITAPAGLPFALVLLAINLWVLFENRERYLPMLQ